MRVKNLFLILFALCLCAPLASAKDKKTELPYTVPGLSSYQHGQVGTRQNSEVDSDQKDYPEGWAVPGKYSYDEGSLRVWQKNFRPQFIELMGLSQDLVSNANKRSANFKIEPLQLQDNKKHPLSKLLDPISEKEIQSRKSDQIEGDCTTENSRGRPLYSDYYPPRYLQKEDHLVLFSCKNDDQGIRLYRISYKGYQGKKIYAYVFIPNDSKAEFYKMAGDKVPSLIYYHGHGSTKEDASFNPNSYVRGIGYHAALNGYLVITPDIRGFGESEGEEGHKKMAERLRAEGSNFLAANALDAIITQDIIEQTDWKKFGLKRRIDKNFNVIAGISLGGQVTLTAGALDERFEVVSTHGIFIGYEVLFSKFHCHCSKMPKLSGKVNIFDVALLVANRTLHIGMGAKDQFFNTYSKSAIEMLAYNLSQNDREICFGQNDTLGLDFLRNMSVRNRFKAGINCPLVLEVAKDASHEVIGYGYQLHFFWHDYLAK